MEDYIQCLKKMLDVEAHEDVIMRKYAISWDFLCDIYGDDGYSAAYYVMEIGRTLILDGYTVYSTWKKRMCCQLSFLNSFPYSYCSEKELNDIVDNAWNSYYRGEALWYIAWQCLPFYKKQLINNSAVKFATILAVVVQIFLILNVSFNFVYSIALVSILSVVEKTKYEGKKAIGYLYPVSLFFYNYISSFMELSATGGFSKQIYFINLNVHDKTMCLHVCNVLLILSSLILFLNKDNLGSLKRADSIRDFRKYSLYR